MNNSKAYTSLQNNPITAATRTSNQPTEHLSVFSLERVNLESYQLVWLGSNINSIEEGYSTVTVKGLRKIVDYTKLFDNVNRCKAYIQQTNDTITFLVCSEQLGEIFIPQIHDLENIWSIYIYCNNKEYHQQWTTKYSKVSLQQKKLYSEADLELTSEILLDKQSTRTLLCDILCYLPYPENYCHKLINLLKVYYNGNTAQLRILQEFERDYRPDRAISWYTRGTCLFNLINKAFRQNNIELVFLFGFFLQDLYRQLKEEHKKFKKATIENPLIKVYRGQIIRKREIGRLIHWRSFYIAANSAFSTALDRSVALAFLNQSAQPNDEFQSVLFEIEIDVRLTTRPFANISHLSNFSDELEILFINRTEFKLEHIFYNEDENIWIATLKLINDDDMKSPKEFESTTKRKCLKNCLSALYDPESDYIRESKIIIIFLNKLSDLFPSEKWILAFKFYYIGSNESQDTKQTGFDLAFSNYEEALKIWFEYVEDDELNCSMDKGVIHQKLADLYVHIKNKNLAYNHYNLSISYYQSAIKKAVTDCERLYAIYQLSQVYDKKANLKKNEQDILVAIKYSELYVKNMLQFRSPNSLTVANCFKLLAILYRSTSIDNALINFQRALKIHTKREKLDTLEITSLCKQIIDIYMHYKHDYRSALKYQLINQEHIMKQIVQSTATLLKKYHLAESYVKLSDIYVLLNENDKAYENLIKAMELHQESDLISFAKGNIADIEVKLAHIHVISKEYDLANECLISAIKLYKESSSDWSYNRKWVRCLAAWLLACLITWWYALYSGVGLREPLFSINLWKK
ncbi:unnamed protein product [Didymodactylos carnosus]|uniref:NAD(P)(+)--arginine ADP-ribosyltransferase n=1 Tax=Didymodactylos carnosus TaxID=1234261 RepID=A0A8S2DAT8_9BILA|nr:unnamed protein product [Didymodactylos carnosus]CAF3634467.1 unnamed protein product [Didymodactylos carnosus]